MCKISFERIENKENKIIKGKGTGFFVKLMVIFQLNMDYLQIIIY